MGAQESWFEEKESAWLYRCAAAAEPDARMRKLFDALAQQAEAQAALWTSAAAAEFRPSWRAKLVAQLLRIWEPRQLRGVLTAMKVRGLSAYDVPGRAGHLPPISINDVERQHSRGGGNLRAAVFGVNDGLVSNTCLIMGVAAAGGDSHVLITGIAGLLAGAFSMAAGEYVSMRSQREMFEHQIALEREELAEYPQAEAEELALIYEARGMPLDRARQVSSELMRTPDHALDVLAREELGLDPQNLGSPWGAALASFIAFAAGAIVPVAPFLFGAKNASGLQDAIVLAGLGLFGVGTLISLFTGRRALLGGLRMLAIGAAAAAVTYLVGRLLGGVVS
jgi:VIT1/CCC1 family predicted Fe2+/Mn2+ transporter